jgi:hypothetical protein
MDSQLDRGRTHGQSFDYLGFGVFYRNAVLRVQATRLRLFDSFRRT